MKTDIIRGLADVSLYLGNTGQRDYMATVEVACSEITQLRNKVESLDKKIEDQEERIAIMTEGEKHGHWIITNMKNVYGGIVIKCSCCDSRVIVQDVDDEKYCRTCGAMMDEPPKEGEAE